MNYRVRQSTVGVSVVNIDYSIRGAASSGCVTGVGRLSYAWFLLFGIVEKVWDDL